MSQLAQIWRHPIKAVGRETLKTVELIAGQTLPYDRHWAIAHEDAKYDPTRPEWARCGNFARAARGHRLMAVNSLFDEATHKITLTHPDLDEISVTMDQPEDAEKLVAWVAKISDPKRSMPSYVTSVKGRGMTDSSAPTLSLHANASLTDLSKRCDMALDQRRFRGNLWIDGLPAWSEFDLIGKTVRIGAVTLEITKPIERCMATTVNPDTGISDAPTLEVLQRDFGHRDFGVQAMVVKSGRISVDDQFEVL